MDRNGELRSVELREVLLRAEEDAVIAAARDRATGDDRMFLDGLLRERARNAKSLGRRGGWARRIVARLGRATVRRAVVT